MSDPIDPDVVTDYENATWSRCAESYAETFHLLSGLGVPLLVKAAGVAPGRDVLDLGSGPGESTAMIAATGARVTGVDFSKPMIETARRRHPTLRFHESDVEVLPFGDGSYDAVVANCVVHHLARPGRVFEEVARVLRPCPAAWPALRRDRPGRLRAFDHRRRFEGPQARPAFHRLAHGDPRSGSTRPLGLGKRGRAPE